MAAVVSVRVYTGTNAATESTAQTAIAFLSADSAATDGNTAPITVGNNSFTKHLRLKIDSGIINSIGNAKFWTDGSGTANVALRAKGAGVAIGQGTGGASPGTGGTTPTATTLTGDIDAYTLTTGNRGEWDTGSYTVNTHVTKEIILQLQPNSSAAAGNWSETLSYAYDET